MKLEKYRVQVKGVHNVIEETAYDHAMAAEEAFAELVKLGDVDFGHTIRATVTHVESGVTKEFRVREVMQPQYFAEELRLAPVSA